MHTFLRAEKSSHLIIETVPSDVMEGTHAFMFKCRMVITLKC